MTVPGFGCALGIGCQGEPVGHIAIGEAQINVCADHAYSPRWAVVRHGEQIAWRAERWEAEAHAIECNLAYNRFGEASVVELPSYAEAGALVPVTA